jgi:hypothetical protein
MRVRNRTRLLEHISTPEDKYYLKNTSRSTSQLCGHLYVSRCVLSISSEAGTGFETRKQERLEIEPDDDGDDVGPRE